MGLKQHRLIRPVAQRATALALSLVIAAVGAAFLGPAAAAASTLLVPRQYPTIQAAVNAANPGDTIRIRPGTYSEQVSIAKNLTITGAGARRTTIHAPGVLTPGSLGKASIVDVHGGATVRISELTVSGPGPNSCGNGLSLNAGIRVVEGATLDLSDTRVLDIQDTPVHDCFPNGLAIAIGDFPTGAVGHAKIHDVVVSHYQFAGIVVFSPSSTATITDNSVDAQVDPSTVVNPIGIEVAKGAVAKVSDNVIKGNRCSSPELECGPDPITQSQAVGLVVAAPFGLPGPGTEFSDNVVSGNDTGILLYAAGNCCNVHDNRILNNTLFGIAIQDGVTDISNDTIRGGAVGVGVIADTTNSIGTLHDEHIFGTSVANTKAIQCCGFTATVVTQSSPGD
jgi:parallel beta-helix repeat protein